MRCGICTVFGLRDVLSCCSLNCWCSRPFLMLVVQCRELMICRRGIVFYWAVIEIAVMLCRHVANSKWIVYVCKVRLAAHCGVLRVF